MTANAPAHDAASEMLWQCVIQPLLASRIGEFRRDVRQAFLNANPSLGEKRTALYDQAFEVAAHDLVKHFHATQGKILSFAEDEDALETWMRVLSGPDGPVLGESLCRLVPLLNDVAKEALQTAGISAHRTAVQACLMAQE